MFCKHCGSALPEGASFCMTCGKKTTADAPEKDFDYVPADTGFDFEAGGNTAYSYDFAAAPAPAPQPMDEERSAHGGRILCFAILALALSLSFYLAIVGTVFYILARVQLGKYIAKYGETEGRASVGKALSIAALPVNIVMIVCFLIVIIAIALTL
ncbi:MAG: zinc ribbon domain-containing protein [Clostridia bacterium]|nr:zinc ribbon domain-containing protein [Clostridia bacterium]